MEVGLCDHHAVSVFVLSPYQFRMPESVFIKGGTYIMAHEPISAAYLIHPSHQAVRLYVYPSNVARQQQVKMIGKEHTRNNRRIIRRIVLYEIRIVSWKVGDQFFLEFFFVFLLFLALSQCMFV
jgi:hypothetical protein